MRLTTQQLGDTKVFAQIWDMRAWLTCSHIFLAPNLFNPQTQVCRPQEVYSDLTSRSFIPDATQVYSASTRTLGPTSRNYATILGRCKENANSISHFMDMLYPPVQGLLSDNPKPQGWGQVTLLICLFRLLANSRNAFVEFAGYLQAADANDVILIFPEATWRGYDILGYTGQEEFGMLISNIHHFWEWSKFGISFSTEERSSEHGD